VLWFMIACGNSSADSAAEAVLEDCATATNWTTVGAPFVYTWCTPCHSPGLTDADRQEAPEGVDFATLANVQEQADRFEARVFAEVGMMPPAGGPSAAELAAVADWLDCGLPE
jgi:uncharacterized membrane protein